MKNYRYIVYIGNENTGYYSSYYDNKEQNVISDIVAVFKTEEKAKEYIKNDERLEYTQVLWEE